MIKNKTTKHNKNILAFVLIVFVLSFFALDVSAGINLNWENPNKTGKASPYKFKVTDVVNSQLMMDVVGCTGAVKKVSNFIMKPFQKKLREKEAQLKAEIVEQICKGGKGYAEGTAAIADKIGTNMTEALKDLIDCEKVSSTTVSPDKASLIREYDRVEELLANEQTELCFNGIAYTLAKNQLTSFTRHAMNWINSGFEGDPMYVQNITNFTNSIQRELIEPSADRLLLDAYPYGDTFLRLLVDNYDYGFTSGLKGGATYLLDNLTSDLSYFITDPRSYYSNEKLTEREREIRAKEAFQEDFMTGGWEGWMALTQRDYNNPVGFSILASQEIEREANEKLQETRDELLQNNGFLSQKRCVEYAKPVENPSPTLDKSLQTVINTTNDLVTKNPVCVKYEVVTPGSLIKDKISVYLNSPERQLELADDINSVLNSLFSSLLSVLETQGLSSIRSEDFQYNRSNMGVGLGSNKSEYTGINESLGSGYKNGSFDLTRNLGNRFIYNYDETPLGTWNAKTNTAVKNNNSAKYKSMSLVGNSLVKNVGPVLMNENGDLSYPVNVFFNVTTSGKTELFDNGYNGWEVGDRAFWDGENWQNWKCKPDAKGNCTSSQKNPIAERGVIQIQKDYIVAAKELLGGLSIIMPKIGELDYCIPGPNMGWESNSSDSILYFTDFIFSLSSEYKNGNLFKRDSTTYSIAKQGDEEFDNYYNLFSGSSSQWSRVTQTPTWKNINFLGNKGIIKKDKEEYKVSEEINEALDNISKNLDTFLESYGSYINNLYGADSLMQKPFLYKENDPTPIENSDYLEVAQSANNITKDIFNYDEEIYQKTIAYKQAMINADSNIYKLNNIKDEVSAIIKKAQERRNARMIEILNNEAKKTGGKVLTESEYRLKYKDCLEEEDIKFYDDTEIEKNTGAEPERCSDELDNDLDGLVDDEDPDCPNYSSTRRGSTGTQYIRSGGSGGGDTESNINSAFDQSSGVAF